MSGNVHTRYNPESEPNYVVSSLCGQRDKGALKFKQFGNSCLREAKSLGLD